MEDFGMTQSNKVKVSLGFSELSDPLLVYVYFFDRADVSRLGRRKW